jgi:predicted RNase H-like HicB family nuclease
MPSLTIKDYPIQLFWDPAARYYVAEVEDIPTCSADGPTPAGAVANLEETFAVLKESYLEEGLPLPEAKPATEVTIEMLKRLSSLVKVSALAKEAGLPPNRLATKLRRSQPLRPEESRALLRALRSLGIFPVEFARKSA